MSSIDVPLHNGGFGQTARKDDWWIEPLLVFLGFSAFIVYSTWAALQGNHYTYGPYLSPFYSPLLMTDRTPGWWPAIPAVFGGDADPLGARRIPLHLLLLSRRLLQGLLGGPGLLRGRRASQDLLGRADLPADPAKRPSLFPVSGARFHRHPAARCLSRRCGSTGISGSASERWC